MNPLGLHIDGRRPTILRPASSSRPSKNIEAVSWSVFSGSPGTHYSSGSVPGHLVGSYNSPFTQSFFAGQFETGELKAIMEFRKPSTNEVIGLAASNIRKLIIPMGPRSYIGDSAYRDLDCTMRIKMISEEFTGSALTWSNAPASDASPAFTLSLQGVTGGHIGLVQTLIALHIDGEQLDQSKTYYGLEMTVDTSFTDNGVPTQFIEPYGWWSAGGLAGVLRGNP